MNIYEIVSMSFSEEVVTIIAESENIRIERIISAGQVTD